MRHLHLLVFLLLCLNFSHLYAEEKGPALPDPNALTPDWWEYFEVSGTTLENRIRDFENHLQTITASLDPKNQERATPLVENITANLKAWAQKSKLPPTPTFVPPTLVSRYSIHDILEIHRRVRKEKIKFKAMQDTRKDTLQQIQAIQNQIDQLAPDYKSALANSEDKTLVGLEIINFQSTLAIKKRDVTQLNQEIDVEKKRIEKEEEILQEARLRLYTDQAEVTAFNEQAETAKTAWDEAKIQLRKQESQAAPLEAPGDLNRAKMQTHQLNLTQAKIDESTAHNHYLFQQMLFQFARILQGLEQVDFSSLHNQVKEWEQALVQIKKNQQEWTAQSRRIIQNTSRLLSLRDKESSEVTSARETINKLAQSNLIMLQQLNYEIEDSLFLLKTLDRTATEKLGIGGRWLQEGTDVALALLQQLYKLLSRSIFHIGLHPVTFFSLLQSILILIASFWASRLLIRTLRKVAVKRVGIQKSVIYRVTRLIHYTILALGFVIALSFLGFDFSNLLLVAGALGVGLGFGLQSIFNNFISGIIMLFESHLKIGDFIELESGARGEIREINVRSTVIRTNNGEEVLVPNAEIISTRVINWTLSTPYRRVSIPFSVAYGSDKDLVARVVLEAAKKVPSTLEQPNMRPPSVYLSNLGDNALEFQLIVWVNESSTRRTQNTRSAYLWVIETALRENGISIPFPQRDIHIKNSNEKANKL